MKNKVLRIIALLSALCMLLSFVACNGDEGETTTTTTTTTESATVDATVDDTITELVETEVVVTDKSGETVTDKEGDVVTEKVTVTKRPITTKKDTTTKKETTTKKKTTTTKPTTTKKTDNAPVGGTIAEIVEYYNNAANASKAKKNFSVKKKEVTDITIDSVTNIKPNALNNGFVQTLVLSLGNALLTRLGSSGEVVQENFVNGEPTVGDVQKDNYFPIMGNSKMSTLTASGVKSAKCIKDGNGYLVTIVLKTEVGTLTNKPTAHAACTNYLRIEALDINPFFVREAAMKYIDNTNSGTKIVAKINKNNLLDSMDTYMTIKGSGNGGADLSVGEISASAALHGTYTCEIDFIW